MSAAEIRPAGRGGVFCATDCTIEHGVVHAHGRWRHRHGPNYSQTRYGELREYSWPLHAVDEVRWMPEGEVTS